MRALTITCCLFGCSLSAQMAGSLDPSFNPTDPGLGKGDGRIGVTHDLAVLPDGRFLAVGEMERIARYLADGAVDPGFTVPSFSAGGHVRSVALQSDGKILVGGTFTTVAGVSRARIARLLADGALDASFDPGTGFNGSVSAIAIQTDGSVIVGGSFSQFNGTPKGRIARLTATGALDATFGPGTGFTSSEVKALALQTDGRVLVGQGATSYNGAPCARLLRLNTNGSVDATFNGPGAGPNAAVLCMALRDDGRIDVGGSFTMYNGASHARMARLLADGTVDPTFSIGSGFDADVTSLLAKPLGEVLVGGHFITCNNTYRAYHARLSAAGALVTSYDGLCGYGIAVFAMAEQSGGRTLTAGYYGTAFGNSKCRVERFFDNGALDPGFDPGTGINSGLVWKVLAQTGGKVIVMGMFTKYNGQRAIGLVRVGLNGEYDQTFQTGFGAHPGCDVCLNAACAAVQSDGKILVGGIFPYFNGVPAPGLVRLNTDGSIDPTFSVAGIVPSGTLGLTSIAVQSDGRILISGAFQTLYGTPRNRIARLSPTGGLDASFDPGTGLDGMAAVIRVLPNASIIIGGGFTTYNGVSSAQLVRVLPSGTRDASLNVGTGFLGTVADVEVFSWGDYLVGGNFSQYNGAACNHLARLNSYGVMQTTSAPATFPVRAVEIAGTVNTYVVGGYGGDYHVNRLNFTANMLDASFDSDIVAAMDAALVSSDLRPVVAGSAFNAAGSAKNRIARLLAAPLEPLQLRPRIMLQGAYGAGGLMRDDLRVQSLVPIQEPYSASGYVYVGTTAGASTTPAVLATTGPDAVVDWVIVELRSSANPQWLRASCAGLLQRDGDIMAADGGALTIPEFGGDYRLVVRHRNHLPILSGPSYSITTTLSSPSLVGATSAYGTNAQVLVDTGLYGLWTGDATGNGQIRYTGSTNDRDPILLAVGSITPNATVSNVYDRRDTNLDGLIKYTGTANDRDIILTNVGSTTPNNTRTQQLP